MRAERFRPERLSYDLAVATLAFALTTNLAVHAMWGPSPRLPRSTIEQRWLTIDGSAGTSIYRFDGNLASLGFLRYDVSNLAYARWYAPGEVNETGRLVSLGVATLLANGAAEPRRHLFLAAAANVATLIVTKSPLSPAALGALKGAAEANEFTVLLSPDTGAPSAMLESIVSATDRRTLDQTTTGFYLDLTPPTDAALSSSTSWGSRHCLIRTCSRISLTPGWSGATSSRR